MRIAMVGSRGVPALYSGFETAVTEIGVRLVERGHDVIVYCRNGYGDETEPEYKGIRKVYLPRVHLKVADTLSHTLFSLLHAFFSSPDVIIAVNPANGPLLLLPRLRGTPVAINVDGLEWKRGKWPWIGQRYFYFASWSCTKIASAVIADSVGIQDFYRETWGTDSYYASYGGYLQESTQPEILAEYDLAPGSYFLIVARLEPENNTDLIVQAFEQLDTDKTLFIVGGTNFRSGYLERLKRDTTDERVVFAGGIYHQDRLTEIMCNCYAYIHGHMVGGTNPVLLKALGCGAPVLYADVSFNADVARDGGSPFPLTVSGARVALQAAVDDPVRLAQLPARGRQRIRDAYTWEMATDAYEELCRRLHERRPVYIRERDGEG